MTRQTLERVSDDARGPGLAGRCSDLARAGFRPIARAGRALQLEQVARRLKVATAGAQSFTALDWSSRTRWPCGVGDSALLAGARADGCNVFKQALGGS